MFPKNIHGQDKNNPEALHVIKKEVNSGWGFLICPGFFSFFLVETDDLIWVTRITSF